MSAVYFIQRTDGEGPIKIGYSTLPEWRLEPMMHWSPYPLSIIAQVPCENRDAARLLERQLHERYLGWRLHSEWHEPSETLLGDIALIQAGAFDFSILPQPTVATANFGHLGPARRAERMRMHADAWRTAHPDCEIPA